MRTCTRRRTVSTPRRAPGTTARAGALVQRVGQVSRQLHPVGCSPSLQVQHVVWGCKAYRVGSVLSAAKGCCHSCLQGRGGGYGRRSWRLGKLVTSVLVHRMIWLACC